MTMQAEHVNDELLQRHFDGDLSGAESEGLEAHLRECVPCAARRRALGRLANLVHGAALDSAKGIDFNAMFARIERGIEAGKAEAPQAVKPVAQVIPMRKRSPVLSALTAASAGLAVAAAMLLMVYDGGGSSTRPGSVPDGTLSTGTTDAPSTAPGSAAQAAVPSRSEVVEVDFGASTGTVFDIALADGSSTPVVWINDDE